MTSTRPHTSIRLLVVSGSIPKGANVICATVEYEHGVCAASVLWVAERRGGGEGGGGGRLLRCVDHGVCVCVCVCACVRELGCAVMCAYFVVRFVQCFGTQPSFVTLLPYTLLLLYCVWCYCVDVTHERSQSTSRYGYHTSLTDTLLLFPPGVVHLPVDSTAPPPCTLVVVTPIARCRVERGLPRPADTRAPAIIYMGPKCVSSVLWACCSNCRRSM